MITQLPFATPFVYSTKGTSAVSVKSRRLRDLIKSDDENLFRQIADHVFELNQAGQFPEFFSAQTSLIPMPGHAPLVPGAVGTGERIAKALCRRGLAKECMPILVRENPVPKSAFTMPYERPRARQHFESLAVTPSLIVPTQILLVDDFVTRGATLIGAASRLQQAFPKIPIRAFAFVRSQTEGDIESIRSPITGVIELEESGETRRRP